MYSLNGLMVIFTLYFDVANVQKSSQKHDENNNRPTITRHSHPVRVSLAKNTQSSLRRLNIFWNHKWQSAQSQSNLQRERHREYAFMVGQYVCESVRVLSLIC